MTGYGAASLSEGAHDLRIEVRGANHRHLIWKANWPAGLQALEGEADALIKRYVERGSLALSVALDAKKLRPRVCFDRALARRYLTELERFVGSLGLPDRPDLRTILDLPGVVVPVDTQASTGEVQALFLTVLESALQELVRCREREGAALVADLMQRVASLETGISQVEERWPQVIESYRVRLEQRVTDFLAERGHAIETVDLLREVAIYADKADIAEETARFRTHLRELRRMIDRGGRVGRALDFLLQELLREANTIGAKSSDAELAHRVVEIKTDLDRLKEQAQNLE